MTLLLVESRRHIVLATVISDWIYNRRWVQLEIERFDDPAFLPFSVIMADMNGLKLTNDAFGHAVGDEP